MDRIDAEVDRLRKLLKAQVTRSASLRSLENELGVKGGGIRSRLRGEGTLTLAHLLVLLDAVGISPAVFFREAYPGTGQPTSGDGKVALAAVVPISLPEEELETLFGRALLGLLREAEVSDEDLLGVIRRGPPRRQT